MYVRYYMTAAPVTVGPETTVGVASDLLEEHDIRHLPVVDEEGKLLGMVSDRDIRSAFPSKITDSDELMKKLAHVKSIMVSEIMSTKTVVLRQVSTLDDALLFFEKRTIGALPVLDELGRVIGILSFKDLMKAWRDVFGLGGKGSFLIALVPPSSDHPLAPLVHALEGSKIPFDRIIRTPGSEREPPMIYLKVKTYNIISVYGAIEEAGFTVHVPEDQPESED